MREMSVRQWQERFRAGDFSSRDRSVQCEAGWYDWFCRDEALAGRLKKLSGVVLGITDPFILDNYYVWFKNNCPVYGPLYDDVRFEPLSGERDGKYFVISLDSPHEQMKWALFTERYGYAAQKNYYTQKIAENPEWEMAGVFADEGISGTSMKKRREFNKMIEACKQGHIDLILTKSLSRFARNTVDCLETVRMLKANGIGVIFEKENINTLKESSEFLITLFSGFAQAESESLSKNVKWGMQKQMESGIVRMQYDRMLGYRKGADGQPEIVPEEAEVIRRIFRRYLDGYSLARIRDELTANHVPTPCRVRGWSVPSVRSILSNEKYIGDALLQKTYITDCISKRVKKNRGERPMYYVENHHAPIVSREMFQLVQEEINRRNSKRKVMLKTAKTEQGKYSSKYALSELLVCGECGTPYRRCTWARNGKKHIVWRCISRLEFGTRFCHHSPSLDEEKLKKGIIAALSTYANHREEILDVAMQSIKIVCGSKCASADPVQLQSRLNELTAEQTELLDRILEDMDNPDLNARLSELAAEKKTAARVGTEYGEGSA